MIPYLISVSFCLFGFLLMYVAVLRHTTFFQLNRYYLLIGIAASFIIPTITITTSVALVDLNLPLAVSEVGKPVGTKATGNTGNLLSWTVVYLTGAIFFLVRFLLLMTRHIRLIAAHNVRIVDDIRVIESVQRQTFTFFNTVVLPGYEVNPVILAHEKAHVKGRHWIDLLLCELTCVVLWFNPAVYLYRSAIKLQHEFLADSATIENGVAIEEYLKCLLTQIKEYNLALSSRFYSQPIKSRIMMITKNRTPMKFKSIYLLLIPVLCLMLVAFSNRYNSVPSIAPVEMSKARVSSVYGARVNPTTGNEQVHTGIDLEAATGEIVVATADGTVATSQFDPARGNYVVIQHDNVYATSYSHLRDAVVKVGDAVKAGEKIGFVGSTGLSTGPHLHYEVIKNGKAVDPKAYLPGI